MSPVSFYLDSDLISGQMCNVDWDSMVRSMKDAIEDPSDAINLGIGLCVALVVIVNWQLAKWMIRRFNAWNAVNRKH